LQIRPVGMSQAKVGVASLASRDTLIEIEAVAKLPEHP